MSHKSTGEIASNTGDDVDFIARFFLRQMAISRRKKRGRDQWVHHWDAFVATVFLFMVAPTLGIVAFITVLSLHWTNRTGGHGFMLPPKLLVVAVVMAISIFIGKIWLGPRFKQYLSDPSPSLNYDTPRDRRIAFVQLTTVFVISGGLLPAVAFLIVYLLQ